MSILSSSEFSLLKYIAERSRPNQQIAITTPKIELQLELPPKFRFLSFSLAGQLLVFLGGFQPFKLHCAQVSHVKSQKGTEKYA